MGPRQPCKEMASGRHCQGHPDPKTVPSSDASIQSRGLLTLFNQQISAIKCITPSNVKKGGREERKGKEGTRREKEEEENEKTGKI